jgi:hypothetical protein
LSLLGPMGEGVPPEQGVLPRASAASLRSLRAYLDLGE